MNQQHRSRNKKGVNVFVELTCHYYCNLSDRKTPCENNEGNNKAY